MVCTTDKLNNSPGLRNEKFYPLRTPQPALAIRHMVGTDIAFMALHHYPRDLQRQFLRAYLSNFDENDKKLKKEIVHAKSLLQKLDESDDMLEA